MNTRGRDLRRVPESSEQLLGVIDVFVNRLGPFNFQPGTLKLNKNTADDHSEIFGVRTSRR